MNISSVRVLGAGPDTYVLNVYSTNASFEPGKKQLSRDLKAELDLLKKRAQEEEEDIPTRFIFDGFPLLMRTKGSEGFNWILHTERGLTLAINRGSKMHLLAQARLSSEYLWKHHHAGLDAITAMVHGELVSIFGHYIILQPSALDLAADVVGFDLNDLTNLREAFVTRAVMGDEIPADGLLDGPDSIKRRWGRITGLPFGARNAHISALIYNKTDEIKYHSPKKVWFHDLWRSKQDEDGSPLWDGTSPVHRIEIRFKRPALSQMYLEGVFHGIDWAYDLEKHLPGLWAYAVGCPDGGADGLPDGWLRYVVPSPDTNRARWLVHPDWRVIQSAFLPAPIPPSAAEREAYEQEHLLREVDAYLEAHPLPTSKTPTSRRTVAPPDLLVPQPTVFDLRPYIRKRKGEVNQDRAIAALIGWASTYEAWEPRPTLQECPDQASIDISDTLHRMYQRAERYMGERGKDYQKLVAKKHVIYAIDK